ncbi:MAG TPA: cytochrome C, partial [Nitrospiraceae bacterium]|nr:cytochrome C [Nitrospiraceae bacterium]
MKKLVSSLVVLCTTVLFAGLAFGAPSHADRLKGPFASGSDVTKACLQCH